MWLDFHDSNHFKLLEFFVILMNKKKLNRSVTSTQMG